MKPHKTKRDPQWDLFKIELNRIVNMQHPLVQLAHQIDWKMFDQKFEAHFADEGRPAIATRLMVALHYLKYSNDLSDEDAVALWVENPYWQYFSGRQYFEHRLSYRLKMFGSPRMPGCMIACVRGLLKQHKPKASY